MTSVARRAITIRGVVQGVGFRPFAHGLAARLHVAGFVRNQGDGVVIEAEAEPQVLDHLLHLLASCAPPLARIDAIECREEPPRGDSVFRIDESEPDPAPSDSVAADVATCDDCRREIFDPHDRRYGYAFANCTSCGPRLTLITGLPYDRERTTMAGFVMCARCRAEYEDPRDRRFHAQPIACPDCGPRLEVREGGRPCGVDDPIAHIARRLRDGRVAAVKGLGGYHLVCDAANEEAVHTLRRRKARDAKPFAVMVADLAAVSALALVTEAERALLVSPAHPIVLLRRNARPAIAPGVAPGLSTVGVMLPYTPLHHLLLAAVGGGPLVMTSANRSDGPIEHDDHGALERLALIADVFLLHDRPIQVACDDSVVQVVDERPVPVRRARGYAPLPLRLPSPVSRPTLAVGGHLKSTFAFARREQAVISHHIGDLDDYATSCRYREAIASYERLYGLRPERVVHDLHPDYASTRYARARAAMEDLPRLAVQHHHAHMAAVMAEHGLQEPAIGVAFDGTGYGTDGAAWGGEFLVGDAAAFRRAAHLDYVALPGGAQAIREPWRMAVAHLLAAGEAADHPSFRARTDARTLATVVKMVERRLNCPPTSSVGRLFDAVAALAGIAAPVSFEGEAAMRLESLAAASPAKGVYAFELLDGGPAMRIGVGPLVRGVSDEARRGVEAADIARRFHSTLAALIARVCARLRESGAPSTVVLSGGVFVNRLLASEAAALLRDEGFRVYRHATVPPNDGGLSLGQLAVAAALDRATETGA